MYKCMSSFDDNALFTWFYDYWPNANLLFDLHNNNVLRAPQRELIVTYVHAHV